jgi:plasmid stabilization system protein ParE
MLLGSSALSTNPPLHSKLSPNRGRPGKKQGTRELVIPSLPYIVAYQVSEDTVYIARILHAAQQWPS